MELDRPHLRSSAGAATSELFICFTSRLSSSSSSMKLTKSILSPGRAARDGPASLSSSLSRRLRTNGSLKGGQASPFFTTTTTTRKRGCTFENPEPSSPKVTCIGQVRVKTKKKVKQSRSLSKRRSGEASFRKIEQACGDGIEDKCQQQQHQRYSNASAHYQQQPQECLPHRNQRWVHLPISICEALRAFGAEFSCLFPCKTSCFSTSERDDKGEKHNGCGAVFTRWLVSVNDGEGGGKRREIELVVGGEDEEQRMSSRRHVFEDIEVKDDRIEVKGQSNLEEATRVSICIPPKNALLLMRCRSDPMKMADLANRFTWDAPDPEDIEQEIDVEENVEQLKEVVCEVKDEVIEQDVAITGEEGEEEHEIPDEAQANLEDFCHGEEELGISSNEELILGKEEEEEVESNMSSFEALLDQETRGESYEDCPIQGKEEVEDNPPICHLSPSPESESETQESNTTTVEETSLANNDEVNQEEPQKEERAIEIEKRESQELVKKEKVLPECLLLMMCEPKLSMEVSKETWVCSTDFIRWLPERPRKPSKSTHEPVVKRRLSIDSKPRSMATMIEQKLVNAVAYEPFVLTRCKSEPMRTAAAKLMPDSCFWKNAMRKLEPHRRGVGAAGVGF